jgi:hypothetical protein
MAYHLRRTSLRTRLALGCIVICSAALLLRTTTDGAPLAAAMHRYWPTSYSPASWDVDERDLDDLGAGLDRINILLIHVGTDPVPNYFAPCITQIRATNPISDNVHIWAIVEDTLEITRNLVSPYTHSSSDPHLHLIRPSTLQDIIDVGRGGSYWDDGFWRMTTERMFYVAALAEREGMENIVLMESDNLLYAHLRDLLPIFKRHYAGVGMTKDNPNRGIAGLIW